ncbi:MAG: SpoIID/LytB domain-containing protein [Armatimonadota bacterium]|nr:SpoIID/LytB domain-containing protein [bacterium]MDW8321003.1 SpoIID/LytB domain-containing protein [Armatimonadota bacterium]
MKRLPLYLLLLSLSVLSKTQEPLNPEVRVWLTRWQTVPLYITSECAWRAAGAGMLHNVSAGETATVERDGTRLTLRFGNKSLLAKEWMLEGEAPLTLSNAQRSSGRSYRGSLVLRVYKGRLQVLNVLPLEEYLLGVVPLEMPPSFPAEALKAQAIAARSWTVRNRHKHEADGADVCDGTHCQVYGDATVERESATLAVQNTAGIIMVKDDAPVDGVYTADCGGQPAPDGSTLPTVDRDESGRDYCVANPAHYWSLRFSFREVWQALGEDSPPEVPKGKVNVQIVQTDESGRVVTFRILCGDRTREVEGTKLRSRLSLPSTLLRVRLEQGDVIVFEGSGSGHGKGLCQWGAAGRARAGQKAEDILRVYYPGARLAPLSEAMWQWRRNRKLNSVR